MVLKKSPAQRAALAVLVFTSSLSLSLSLSWAQKAPQRSPSESAAPQQPRTGSKEPASNSPTPLQPGPQTSPPNRVELQAVQADWTKVCGQDPNANKEGCYTTRNFGQAADQPPVLAMGGYAEKTGNTETYAVRFLLPVAFLLEPGIRFSIDKGPIQEGRFQICFPNGCFAEAKVKAPVIDQLKKGTVLNLTIRDQANSEVTFALPLAGFGKAFDGPAIDPKALEEQQKALEEQLQKRVEEERKRLESQQPGTTSPPSGK